MKHRHTNEYNVPMRLCVDWKILIYLLIGLLAGRSVQAQGKRSAPEERKQVEIRVDEREAWYRKDNLRVSKEDDKPLVIYHVNHAVQPDTPERMARQYLRARANLLKLRADVTDLVLTSIRETPAGQHVRFRQYIGAYPVYNADLVVTRNAKHTVTFVTNNYKPNAKLPDTLKRAIAEPEALLKAKTYLGITGRLMYEHLESVAYYRKGQTRLAYQIHLVPAEQPIGDWEILIDAVTGDILQVADRAVYANGSGLVFDPDPLSRARATYGSPGFTDNSDNDSTQLTAQLVSVTLPDITYQSGNYYLTGPYAQIVDAESPNDGIFSQASAAFNYTRGHTAFEAVNAYYHIDTSMRYINQTLGIIVMPYQYTGGVRADPHGFDGADNSHYLPSIGAVTFGEGGVDDAEDVEVILHELGHGIHDWITDGNLSQVDGLSEGVGDYWAASHRRSFGFWTTADPQYHWIMQWDGHNEFWAGRDTNSSRHYPEELTGNIYVDGAIWSSTLMQVWEDIGQTAADKNLLSALAMLSSFSNQNDAAHAFIQADLDQYGGGHLDAICRRFEQRGYDVATVCADISDAYLLWTK